jgi:hypothetical protein
MFKFLQQKASGINLAIIFTAFVVFCGYYGALLLLHTSSDIQAHAQIAYAYAVNDDKLFPNFLYFFLVALFAGFSKNIYFYYGASVVLISLAITAKFFLTQYYLKKYSLSLKEKVSCLFPAIAMLFAFALPAVNLFTANEYYLGQLPANTWHNSTVIFLMPFSMLLFFKTYGLLIRGNERSVQQQWQVFFLVVINALIKPSFLFTLIPSVFLFFAWFNLFSASNKKKVYVLLPFIGGIIFIAIEYYLIFMQTHISTVVSNNEKSSVVIAPFVVWKNYSPNMLIAFFTSCFFPLVYIVASKFEVLKNKLVQFAVVNYVIAILIWILFAEEGPRKFDANFIWQVIVATYLLFLCFLIQLISDWHTTAISKTKKNIIATAFLLHFVWGVVYWIKIIIFKGYF